MMSNIEYLYEELRKLTDGMSESMTHDDAVKQIKYWHTQDERIKELEAALVNQSEIANKYETRYFQVKAELAKWQRPFDQERLDAAKQQASHQDSLAAMQVYIIALEHGIKHMEAERDALKADAERVRVAVFEFINDWRKGDFDLPELAKHDVMAIIDTYDSIDAAMKEEKL